MNICACQESQVFLESSSKDKINLFQKGERLPIQNVDISWDTREENPRAVNNFLTYFNGGGGEKLYAYQAYYANNIKEKRQFFFPDNTYSARFYFGGSVHMRNGDKVIFREGLSVSDPSSIESEMDGFYTSYREPSELEPDDPNYPEARVYGNIMRVDYNEILYGAEIEFDTDQNNGSLGWSLNSVDITYDPKLPRRFYNYPIYKNQGYDVILRASFDVVQFRVNYNPSKDYILNLLHMSQNSINDFDLYVKVGTLGNPQNAGPSNYDYRSINGSWFDADNHYVAKNEIIEIAKNTYSPNVDTLYISVVSYEGGGHARLFVNQTTRLSINIGLKKPFSLLTDPSWQEEFLSDDSGSKADVFSEMSRNLFEATDGQYLIDKFNVYTDSCPGYCFAYLVPPRPNPVDRNGRYHTTHITVETHGEYGDKNVTSIADIFTHEYGHELALPDQYYSNASTGDKALPSSGHSIMIGSGWARDANIKDFSVRHNHGYDPFINKDNNQLPTTLVGDLSNWENLTDNGVVSLFETFRMFSGDPSFQSFNQTRWCSSPQGNVLEETSFDSLITVEVMDDQGYGVKDIGLYKYAELCGGLVPIN